MTTEQRLIEAKFNLLELGAYLGNASEACRAQGYSRDTLPLQEEIRRGRHRGPSGGQLP
jgi:hypothetical protein